MSGGLFVCVWGSAGLGILWLLRTWGHLACGVRGYVMLNAYCNMTSTGHVAYTRLGLGMLVA